MVSHNSLVSYSEVTHTVLDSELTPYSRKLKACRFYGKWAHMLFVELGSLSIRMPIKLEMLTKKLYLLQKCYIKITHIQ